MSRDPHLLTKIATCPTVEELDAMCAAFREREFHHERKHHA